MRLQIEQLRKLIREEIENIGYNKNMETKMTLNELINYVRKVCPNCVVSEEGDGNIVIVTNMTCPEDNNNCVLEPIG
jgi:hypothetical protein